MMYFIEVHTAPHTTELVQGSFPPQQVVTFIATYQHQLPQP